MQSSCIGSLMELAEKDNRVLYLTADSGEGGLDKLFRMNFRERAFDFGIAEGNMIAAAAGMATVGKIPFVYTAAPFLIYRAYEFIRDDVCLQNLNVKLIGTGSGISVSSLGPTHHTTEDIAILRVLPHLMILSPATPLQVSACMKKAYEHVGPVYIRLAMSKEKEYFSNDYKFNLNKPDIVKEGKDASLFSTGSILSEVIKVSELLEQRGISTEIVNITTVKPFDRNIILERLNKQRLMITIEEHNVMGGLGSMLSEIIADEGVAQKLLRIGLKDTFSVGYGKLDAVRRENGLDAETIVDRLMREF